MKQRFWLFIGGLALLAIIVISVAASSSGRRRTPAGLITCTVNGDVGIDKVIITNQNTGKHMTIPYTDLPCAFNLTLTEEGEVTIRLNATVVDGYVWDHWEINQYPWFSDDNPITIKISEAVSFNPRCLVK